MMGTLGPYTSASSNPTSAPNCFSASARFTATVVFPTPPFPLATATRFFTPWIGSLGGWGIGGGGMFRFSCGNKVDDVRLIAFHFVRETRARPLALFPALLRSRTQIARFIFSGHSAPQKRNYERVVSVWDT